MNLIPIILCGGQGTRLRSEWGGPKCLAPVNGRPFLAHLFDQLLGAGVSRVVLATGYKGGEVERSFGGDYNGIELEYSREPEPLGTGGGLRRAWCRCGDSRPALVLNGDSYVSHDLSGFLRQASLGPDDGTMLITYLPDAGRYGRVLMWGTQLVGYEWCHEQVRVPRIDGKLFLQSNERRCGWVDCGVRLLRPKLLEQLPESGSLEDKMSEWAKGSRITVVKTHSPFIDIGVPESYQQADSFFNNLKPSALKMAKERA